MAGKCLVYGASGYSGSKIVAKAVEQGIKPVLAGRNEKKISSLADKYGLDFEIIDLGDLDQLEHSLKNISVVLNCAGPFLATFKPMVNICLKTGTHYLDISGEVTVYEALASLHEKATEAGVMLMPGVGFDMVPGDCLALLLKEQQPDATELDIGYSFGGTFTRGSIRSALASFSPDSLVRRDNNLERLTTPLTKTFDFGPESIAGEVECLATTLGDVSMGWRTTHIPNITAYLHMSQSFTALAEVDSEEMIQTLPEGPSEEQLISEKAFLVGEVRNQKGQLRRARLICPQVYAATFPLAVAIAQRVSEGVFKPGFQTPASLLGQDYIFNFEGYSLEWLD